MSPGHTELVIGGIVVDLRPRPLSEWPIPISQTSTGRPPRDQRVRATCRKSFSRNPSTLASLTALSKEWRSVAAAMGFPLRVTEVLDSLERDIYPKWLIPQFRHHALNDWTDNHVDHEAQQDVLLATFPGIRDAVRELLGVRADALARKFHETHDMAVKDEIERLLKEYGRLEKPWKFVVI